HHEAAQRLGHPLGERVLQADGIDAIAIVERRGDRRENAGKLHRIDFTPRLPSCSTRFTPRTTRNIAAAGLSSHGKSAKTRRLLDASCSIVPQLATGSGKP